MTCGVYLSACDRFFLDSPNGAGRIAWDLCRLMRDRGYRVTALCGSTDSDPAPGLEVVEGIEVVRYRFAKSHPLSPFRMERQIAAARETARRYLGGRHWDIVHTHMPASGLAAYSFTSSQGLRVSTIHSPVVLEQQINWRRGLRGYAKLLFGQRLLAHYERRLLARADRIHVLSDYTARELSRFHGPELGTRAQTIPWWHDPATRRTHSKAEARKRLGLPVEGKVFFTLRRFVPRTGVDLLLQAAAPLLRSYPLTVIAAGDGPEREPLMRRYPAEIAQQQVRLPGRISDEEAALAYQAADLFVLPTRALECFGIIAVEALGYGCPVVGTRVGAIPEVLEELLPAALCKPGDVAALRAKLQAVLDGSLQFPSADELTAYATRRFGRDALSARYLELLGDRPEEGRASA